MEKFCVSATGDKIWNTVELIQFLSENQNKHICIDLQPEAICLHNLGLYKFLDCFSFAQVDILTWNPLEFHDRYNIIFKGFNFWFSKISAVDNSVRQWNNNKKFLCLYHRPTAARLGIASYINSKYSDDAHIHFSIGTDADSLIDYELDKLLSWDPASISATGELINKLPLELGSSHRYTKFDGYYYDDPLTNLYKNILVDVVVESHVAGNTFFPTEKTIRPMLLKKPFIIFGSKDYLAYLRQLGFRTFADFWDEDYDGYDSRERYARILKLIDSIAGLSYDRLETMYWDMQYTLEHNYNLLVDKKYNTDITQI